MFRAFLMRLSLSLRCIENVFGRLFINKGSVNQLKLMYQKCHSRISEILKIRKKKLYIFICSDFKAYASFENDNLPQYDNICVSHSGTGPTGHTFCTHYDVTIWKRFPQYWLVMGDFTC